jgi:tRNA U34 5-methylaminomethyl-2-thiouridine-forming methyltransferase MnmC
MINDLEIVTTSDGSHTVWSRTLNETYHSIHGAVQESMHVFLQNGLEHYWKKHQEKHICIFEVGFGTGLNALLTFQYAVQNQLRIRYVTLEPFPLPESVWSELNYETGKQEHLRALHECSWENEMILAPQFKILKLKATLDEVALDDHYDLIYFDAFAPLVQPELWAFKSLKKVTSKLNRPGVFVTYSARGQLKRDLKDLELIVETLPGPPGKNEMVRASKD